MGEIGIAHVFVFSIDPVAVDVERHRPIGELGAFGVGIVHVAVLQPVTVLSVDQHIRFGGIGAQQHRFAVGRLGGLDDLALDGVVRRQDAAIGKVEPGTVHAQFVVDGDVVLVLGRNGGSRRCHGDGNRHHCQQGSYARDHLGCSSWLSVVHFSTAPLLWGTKRMEGLVRAGSAMFFTCRTKRSLGPMAVVWSFPASISST